MCWCEGLTLFREALESEVKAQKAMVSKLTVAARQREEAEVVVKEYEKECTKLISVSCGKVVVMVI